MEKVELNQEVVRTKGDYVVGRIGKVIEIDNIKKRARVAWEGNPRTWVSFDSLEPTSIPYEIIPAKYGDGGNGRRISWAQYKRKL